MPRVVSFIVLLGILLLIGTMFFQVMLNFVVPLFVAAVLVVIFKPLHQWVQEKLPDRPRLAALATTVLIVLVVLLPTVLLGWRAYVESHDKVVAFLQDEQKTADLIETVSRKGSGAQEWYKSTFKVTDEEFEANLKNLVETAGKKVSGWVVSAVKAVFALLVGLAISIFALYYFLADGPGMVETLMRLSPLDDKYERELLDKFSNVSRAVVVASMLSGIVQGILAGIGFYVAFKTGGGETSPPIALLTMLTIVLSLVPFVGAAAVWIPVAGWLYFVDGRTAAAITLALYCGGVVSMVDNVIKPYVLHGQSNLHPLLALISVLGGVQVLGPVGILVGPMLVAFLQAILNMVHKELHLLGAPDAAKQAALDSLDPTVRVQAEAAAGDSPAGEWVDEVNKAIANRPTPTAAAQSSSAPAKKAQSKRSGKRKR